MGSILRFQQYEKNQSGRSNWLSQPVASSQLWQKAGGRGRNLPTLKLLAAGTQQSERATPHQMGGAQINPRDLAAIPSGTPG